ncbi:hypothetical protein BV25DRAFT_1973088 [Artomyces pyxidatus]|uniref:Uncharacterized protein n=1 Tax=Artomyces pyxidatus TaxID=48021 RepID=A0ACB8SNN1_9AGAM|nr:hypothetical protein BV25DRAFT_1973088 [Artomyces pyxidatus]
MTTLHVTFTVRNQHAFQRYLEGSKPAKPAGAGSSGSRSWTRPSPLTLPPADVNARDTLGRTVLHLACAATDPAALEYVRMLLANPGIDVNVRDKESRWTALHRALYHGNLAAAILLLQRSDTDASVKDAEGYTAFDLYNTTVEHTKPGPLNDAHLQAELFTWGSNRNAALGHADGDDRAYPEQVTLRRGDKAGGDLAFQESLAFRLKPAAVRDVEMSRLHTVVVTDERRGNIRVCGFASTGRLGPGGGQHTQHLFGSLAQFEHTIVSVALGQDHTLALTDIGTVLSWGLNRFSQLGYELPVSQRGEEPVQATPRGVTGLKRETVIGVAACKTASACWTAKEVFTWGKNNGQLGACRAGGAYPVQPVPRIVSRITRPVTSIALTDTGMACLLATKEVILLSRDVQLRINFPSDGFHNMPSDFLAYRPPHAINNTSISKVICNDSIFAAVSANGEMFTFSAPSEGESASTGKEKGPIVKPQRVWALRKQWSAVRDAALGSDGSMIICTDSGHVFVRERNLKSGQGPGAKTFKFQRVPYIQRAVSVRANGTGAMSALKSPFRPRPVEIVGNSLAQDLAKVRPYMQYARPGQSNKPTPTEATIKQAPRDVDEDEDTQDVVILDDASEIERLCEILIQDKRARRRYDGRGLYDHEGAPRLASGADLMIRVQSSTEFPVHRLVLGARCPTLSDLLSGKKGIHDPKSGIAVKLLPSSSSRPVRSGSMLRPEELPRLSFTGCHALSVLILVHYLYSDNLLAIGDSRIVRGAQALLGSVKVPHTQIVRELQFLARLLDMATVSETLSWSSKRIPQQSMVSQMKALFHQTVDGSGGALRPDVVLQLADRQVFCHSVVLRARTELFQSFFDTDDWTVRRSSEEGMITLNFSHLSWRAMEYVVRFMCCGEEGEMFDRLDFIDSVDALLDLLLDIMSAANELLLDRLVLICASIVLDYLNIHNVCSVFAEAALLDCLPFLESLQQYMAVNMETLLESRMLDDLDPRLIRQLLQSIRLQQSDKLPTTRSNRLVEQAMERNREWLDQQDIPEAIIRTVHHKESPRLSPRTTRRPSLPTSPVNSPFMKPDVSRSTQAAPVGDDIFAMDDSDFVPTLNLDASPGVDVQNTPYKPGPWKAKSTAPKVDMKSILAEAESLSSSARVSIPIQKAPSRDRIRPSLPPPMTAADPSISGSPSTSHKASGSPWRLPIPPASPTPIGAPLPRGSPGGSPALTPPVVHRPAETSRPAPPSGGSPARLGQKMPATGSRPVQSIPGLGPVITPSRQVQIAAAGPTVPRRVPGGSKAWTLSPVQPIVQPSPSGSVSFVAIQQSQSEQDTAPRDRRSLKEIQDEERDRQVEEDFMKWWAAEEERLRQEAEAVAPAPKASRSKKPTSKKQSPKKPPVVKVDASEAAASSDRPRKRPQAQKNKAGHHVSSAENSASA